MANESSSIDSSKGTTASPADSYIGNFISLTSKYEIRYEGILYHLNPQDSTLGLKNVRSYGTEGRKKDGPQVPPSDKVYEYILFRGSDIKDLQVKASRPAEVQEPLQSDPAIIQSKYAAGPSNLSRPVSDASGSIVEASSYNEPLALNTSSDLSRSPPNPSGIQMGLWGPSQATQSFGMRPYDLRTHWQGYNGSAGSTPHAQQHSVSSARIPYPVQNLLEASGSLAPKTMAATNVYDNVSLSPSFASSNSTYSNFKPTLTSLQHPTSPTNSLPSLPLESSLPSHQTAGLNSNSLTMPSFSLASQHVSNMEASLGYNVVPEPVTLLPIQGLLPSTSFVLDSTSDPLLKQPPAMVTPNQLSQPRLSEISQMPKLYPDQKDVRIMGSISLNSLSSVTTPAVQQPLSPLPPSAQQSQHLSQFTEEFDFEAMNERFKKDEVWGYLGKVNKRDNIDGIQHNLLNEQNPGDGCHSGLVSTGDSKMPLCSLLITKMISSIQYLVTVLIMELGTDITNFLSERNRTLRPLAIFNREPIQVIVAAMMVDMVTIMVHITGVGGITTVDKAEGVTRGDDMGYARFRCTSAAVFTSLFGILLSDLLKNELAI